MYGVPGIAQTTGLWRTPVADVRLK